MKYPYGRPRCVKLPKTSLDSAEDGINNSVSSTLSTAGSRYATCSYNVPKCNMRVRASERMWVSPTCFHEDILLEELLFLEAYDPYQMFVRSRQHYRTLGITWWFLIYIHKVNSESPPYTCIKKKKSILIKHYKKYEGKICISPKCPSHF